MRIKKKSILNKNITEIPILNKICKNCNKPFYSEVFSHCPECVKLLFDDDKELYFAAQKAIEINPILPLPKEKKKLFTDSVMLKVLVVYSIVNIIFSLLIIYLIVKL
jgi:hemoglobin-like flavoprotein